jgi:hypothetical protein
MDAIELVVVSGYVREFAVVELGSWLNAARE